MKLIEWLKCSSEFLQQSSFFTFSNLGIDFVQISFGPTYCFCYVGWFCYVSTFGWSELNR